MAKEWVKVDGLSECLDALEELPKSTQTSVLKKVLTDAALPIKTDAAIQAPRRTGKLKLSISISSKLSKRQRSLSKKESPVEVYVGAGPLRQATMQEFGTARDRPQPYLRPAWDGNKLSTLESIKKNLWASIQTAADRIARKTSKFQK